MCLEVCLVFDLFVCLVGGLVLENSILSCAWLIILCMRRDGDRYLDRYGARAWWDCSLCTVKGFVIYLD